MQSVPDAEVRIDLVSELRRIQPDAVFTWYGQPRFTLLPHLFDDLGFHPDHQLVGRLALDSSFGTGVGRLWPNAGGAWRGIRQFYMFCFTSTHCTHYVDIGVPAFGSRTGLQNKIAGYLAHRSQIDNATMWTQVFTSLSQLMASYANQPSVQYAENFEAFF